MVMDQPPQSHHCPPAIYQQAGSQAVDRFCHPIVDSNLSWDQALAQNPNYPAPQDIIDSQKLLTVTYYSFDHKLHSGQIVVAKSVSHDVEDFFDKARQIHFPIAHAIPAADPRYQWSDDKMMADNNTSGYNYRTIAGRPTLSNHAKGLAFDVNTFLNPYIYINSAGQVINDPPGATYDPSRPGTLSADHPLVKFMQKRGWTWGGSWTLETDQVIDYQHFEKPDSQ